MARIRAGCGRRRPRGNGAGTGRIMGKAGFARPAGRGEVMGSLLLDRNQEFDSDRAQVGQRSASRLSWFQPALVKGHRAVGYPHERTP